MKEENELEGRWLDPGLVAVSEVSHGVAQEIHVENMVLALAGICPGREDECLGRGFVRPESMATHCQPTLFRDEKIKINRHNLPGTPRDRENSIFQGECVFHPVPDDA